MSLNKKLANNEHETVASGNLNHSEVDAINAEIGGLKQDLSNTEKIAKRIVASASSNLFSLSGSQNATITINNDGLFVINGVLNTGNSLIQVLINGIPVYRTQSRATEGTEAYTWSVMVSKGNSVYVETVNASADGYNYGLQ